MPKPITTTAELPPVGQNVERYFLDIKKIVDAKDKFELTKDVAAFANAAGGTIVVGAIEDNAKGLLVRYEPLTEKEANVIKDAFTLAVKERCVPKPFIDPHVMPAPGGLAGSIVVVNVGASPNRFISVETKTDKSIEGYGGAVFVCPIRLGTHTVFLTPDQAASMMTTVRHVSVLLESIPSHLRNQVEVMSDVKSPGHVFKMELLEVLPTENRARFKSDGPNFIGAEVSIPLDMIETVWRSNDTTWIVRARGMVHPDKDDARRALFVPS